MDPEIRLTVQEAAEHIGKNPRTIRRWITNGRLPAEMESAGMYMVLLADLRAAQDNPAPRTPGTAVVQVPSADILTIMGRIEHLSTELATERVLRQQSEERINDLTQQLAAKTELLALPGTTPPWYRKLFPRRETHTHAPKDTSTTTPPDERA